MTNEDESKPLPGARHTVSAHLLAELNGTSKTTGKQGPTLVPISAQLELFCTPYNPTQLIVVS